MINALYPYISSIFPVIFLSLSFTCGHSQGQNLCNTEVKLHYKESVGLNGNKKAKLIFQEVENESRCPKGDQCIWEGEAVILLQYVHGDEMINLKLSTLLSSENASAPNQIDTLGYSVLLKDLVPYPESGKSIHKKDYIATLFIRCNS